MLVTFGIVLLGLAHAYVPDDVRRQLLMPEFDATSKSTRQHVVYQDPNSSKHLLLDYQTQQHMHVQLWSLDTIVGLHDVSVFHGKLKSTAVKCQSGVDSSKHPPCSGLLQ